MIVQKAEIYATVQVEYLVGERASSDELGHLRLTMTLNPVDRSSWKIPINIAVRKEGPAPRAALMIKLAVVRTAPLTSGGFTLMMQGLTLTDGMLARQPPAKA